LHLAITLGAHVNEGNNMAEAAQAAALAIFAVVILHLLWRVTK